jgi:hypothetical protein
MSITFEKSDVYQVFSIWVQTVQIRSDSGQNRIHICICFNFCIGIWIQIVPDANMDQILNGYEYKLDNTRIQIRIYFGYQIKNIVNAIKKIII